MKTENEAGSTASALLAQKHAAEQALVNRQVELVAERQNCETRIEAINTELRQLGWKAPRKPREKKQAA